MAHVCGVYSGRYPPLTEVEVKLVESNLSRSRILQGFERVLRHFDIRLDAVISGKALDAVVLTVNPCLNVLGFLDNIAGDEAVGNLVVVNQWVIIDMVSEALNELFLAHVNKASHILQVDNTVFIERC